MISSSIEGVLVNTEASFLAEIVCVVIFLVFISAVFCSLNSKKPNFVSYTPALLTTLGIFGTFAGIVIGLLLFDETNIDESITGLLGGLKTAFVTSLWGILASILFKGLQSLGVITPKKKTEQVESATPEDILAEITRQNKALDTLVLAIGGGGDGSLVSQLKLLRGDVNDNQKLSLKSISSSEEHLSNLEQKMAFQHENFKEFSEKLWIKMQDFADMLSKSATETVIEALKQVITDFNNNLTEQFGENFKQLNEAVKELVTWQENYKVQIAEMVEQYKLGVQSISATEVSVAAISSESQAIPKTMNDLKDVMTVNQNQLSELENHLAAFKDIRDRAVEAVPEIREQIQKTVDTIADSVSVASKHYEELITESDKYIQAHIEKSNTLLDKFVKSTDEGVETIGKKLTESATKVEEAISEGAKDFTEKVYSTNASLTSASDYVSTQTEGMAERLKYASEEMSENVRDMVNGLIEESKAISKTLIEANKDLVKDTGIARDTVVENIGQMQKSLESSLDDVFTAQTQHMNKVFSNIDSGLKEQVSKTGDAVDKQLGMIDQSMQQELNRSMKLLGDNLGAITTKFTADYQQLVKQMQNVVKTTV
jgi:hypothetical protein